MRSSVSSVVAGGGASGEPRARDWNARESLGLRCRPSGRAVEVGAGAAAGRAGVEAAVLLGAGGFGFDAEGESSLITDSSFGRGKELSHNRAHGWNAARLE